MAKKFKLNLGSILIIIGFVFGICSLICLAGAGLTGTASFSGISGSVTYNLAGFIGGNYTVTTVATVAGQSATTTATLEGGVSIFGIIAVTLTVLGAFVTIAGLLFKKKALVLIGGVLFLLSGISIFLLKVAGSDMAEGLSFVDFFKGTKEAPINLGVGTIFYGILSILGGALTTVGAVLKK